MAITEQVSGAHASKQGGAGSSLPPAVRRPHPRGPLIEPAAPSPMAADRSRMSTGTSALELIALAGVGTTLVAVALIAIGVSARFAHPTSFSVGAQAAAVLGFLLSTSLLAVRWLLRDDTSAGALALAGILIGVVIVPTLEPVPAAARAFVALLRLFTILLVVCIIILAGPSRPAQVRASPITIAVLVLALPFALAAVVGVSPIVGTLADHPSVLIGTSATETLIAAAGSLVMLRAALRSHRILDAAAAALLALLAGAMAIRTFHVSNPHGGESLVPVVLQVSGATLLLAVALIEARLTVRQVTGVERRARTRAELVESRLVHAQRRQEGKEHDISSSLGAIDGALHVLELHAALLREDRDRDLLAATRGQLHSIQSLLREGEGALACYPLSEILTDLVVLRAACQRISTAIQPGIVVVGNAPVVVLVVNDLLDNAATHAPGSAVVVQVRRALSRQGYAEITVSDDGPGMEPAEMDHAFEPGWRAANWPAGTGHGIGLARCRELVDGQGGAIHLGDANPGTPPGHRGLRVTVWLPIAPDRSAWTAACEVHTLSAG